LLGVAWLDNPGGATDTDSATGSVFRVVVRVLWGKAL
jgi:hypothetical protein